jgi:hypothetical protein
LGQIPLHSIRISHREPLEPCQLADFRWQRRELVGADLTAREGGQIKIHLPRLPYGELLEIGQQTELRRKRRELVVGDLKTTCCGQIAPDRFDNRTKSPSSVVMCAISLGSEQSLLLVSERLFTFFMRSNSDGTSVRSKL